LLRHEEGSDAIDREQLQRWFPHDEILLASTESLRELVSHQGTLAMLIHAGVPETFLEVVEFDRHLTSGIRTLDEIYDEDGSSAPPGTGDLLFLGYAGQAFFALDGATGEIRQVHTSFGARPFAPSLRMLVRALGAVSEALHEKAERTPTVDALLAVVSSELGGEADVAEPAWRTLLSDVAAYVAD
jgi:hypothetical protein